MTMHAPPRSPVAGGALIALGAILGPVIGLILGQPTLGFLIGVLAGIGISVAIWLRDR